MIDAHETSSAAPQRRRRWAPPLVVVGVAVIGIAAILALADRDDMSTPRHAMGQLTDINQACTMWMNTDGRWDSPVPTWCDDMTDWMNRRMSDGSMTGPAMWGDPDRMRSTCDAWKDAHLARELPAGWCDDMTRGMWPHMTTDWDHWDDWNEWMSGPMMRGG